jgi:hypothetical protein
VPPAPRIRRVNDGGLVLLAADDRPLDVLLDGRRVWTFWTRRDTERVLGPLRRVEWPGPLRRHLNGSARVVVRDTVSEEDFFDTELLFGSGSGRIEVRNQQGVELGMDKSGKLVPTFAGRSEDDLAALLDATQAVIAALEQAGVEPFIAYGTLLGAIREGQVLGHDSDADLGYVSHFSNPVDVVRESFGVQRVLNDHGWQTYRYSGAAFRVAVVEGGVTRGLDVFGGFLSQGRLYLMGEIGTEFREDWVRPPGVAALSGRPMPVPAHPERLLEATYGPGWKVPDPAFRFATADRAVRALGGWFRGTQPGIRHWERRARPRPGLEPRDPSVLARRAVRLATELDAEVLDIGAGRGPDSLWVARQGLPVTAYDYAPGALADTAARAHEEGLSLEVRHLNLTELRSVLAEGTRLAAQPRPRVVIARHVLDATSAFGRESFARLCSMALRDGGRVLADLHVPADDADQGVEAPVWMVGQPDAETVATLLRRAGAERVTVRRLPHRSRPTVRLVGVWSDGTQGPASELARDDASSGATDR